MSVGLSVVALAVATYALRASGVSASWLGERMDKWADSLLAAVLASLIVSGTLAADSGSLTIDARLLGLVVAVFAAAKRLPLLPTLLAAVGATAVLRLVAG